MNTEPQRMPDECAPADMLLKIREDLSQILSAPAGVWWQDSAKLSIHYSSHGYHENIHAPGGRKNTCFCLRETADDPYVWGASLTPDPAECCIQVLTNDWCTDFTISVRWDSVRRECVLEVDGEEQKIRDISNRLSGILRDRAARVLRSSGTRNETLKTQNPL